MNKPLVSICIISYNSSRTITETMDSVANQTYNNMELIVSDDCSKDDTVDVVKCWVGKNADKFVRVEIIETQKNTGISPNCNRAYRASRGEWIKLIAADDIMMPNMVETYINFTERNVDAKLLFSPVEVFGQNVYSSHSIEFWEDAKNRFASLKTSKEQYNELKKKNFVPAASSFIHKEVYKKIGGYDEDILFLEDLPFWVNATKCGYKLFLLDCEPLVKYRVSDTSVQVSNPRFDIAGVLFCNKYVYINPLFYIFKGCIDQMNVISGKSRIAILLIKIGSLPDRLVRLLISRP